MIGTIFDTFIMILTIVIGLGFIVFKVLNFKTMILPNDTVIQYHRNTFNSFKEELGKLNYNFYLLVRFLFFTIFINVSHDFIKFSELSPNLLVVLVSLLLYFLIGLFLVANKGIETYKLNNALIDENSWKDINPTYTKVVYWIEFTYLIFTLVLMFI